jgi:hypothetical protein
MRKPSTMFNYMILYYNLKLLGVVNILYNFQTKGDEINLSCFS